MPNTAGGLPYPAGSDAPDVPGDMQALAEELDTQLASKVAKSIVDAKGDLIVGTAADTVSRLAVGGTNGHVLKVNSSTASGMEWAPIVSGAFTASTTITATNASWPVPALASPIVKVTCIGGGGGGAGDQGNGGNGGSTSFVSGSVNVSASGGTGGQASDYGTAATGTAGFASSNGGQGDNSSAASNETQVNGNGGAITVSYVDLTGISTVNVTIGAGGAATNQSGAGGRGEVIVEYAAG